jgi:hypothetical protein
VVYDWPLHVFGIDLGPRMEATMGQKSATTAAVPAIDARNGETSRISTPIIAAPNATRSGAVSSQRFAVSPTPFKSIFDRSSSLDDCFILERIGVGGGNGCSRSARSSISSISRSSLLFPGLSLGEPLGCAEVGIGYYAFLKRAVQTDFYGTLPAREPDDD